MNIVVCDGDNNFIILLERKITEYCQDHDIPVHFFKFTKIEHFIEYIRTHHCHLAFVDINSQYKKTRIIDIYNKFDTSCRYVLMSDCCEDVSIAYQLDTLDYLCKTDDMMQLDITLERIISDIIQQHEHIKYKRDNLLK